MIGRKENVQTYTLTRQRRSWPGGVHGSGPPVSYPGGGGHAHGRIQTGGTGDTCPLQTNDRQKWSDRFGFVSLAS